MQLTIRVTLTLLFSAFALWAQTPGGDMFVLRASAPESLKAFASMPSYQWLGSYAGDQLTLKLDSIQQLPDDKNFVLASSTPVLPQSPSASSQTPPTRPKTFSYSNGYYTRRKIHKYASIATLPLVVSEAIVGQKLLDSRSDDSLRLGTFRPGVRDRGSVWR